MTVSAAPPALPVRYRPLRGRVLAYAFALLLVATVAGVGVALPPEVRAAFDPVQTVSMVLMLALVVGVLHLVAHPRVDADEDGITVVNVVRRHRLAWGEVVDVVLRTGDPWAFLELSDGELLPVMALQVADGQRGRRHAAQLRAIVRSRA